MTIHSTFTDPPAADAIEIQARSAAANLHDQLNRDALIAQLVNVEAFLAGLESGLHIAQPAGQQISPSADSALGLALRFLTDSLAAKAFISTKSAWQTSRRTSS